MCRLLLAIASTPPIFMESVNLPIVITCLTTFATLLPRQITPPHLVQSFSEASTLAFTYFTMSRARVEEVSDSDLDSDPSEGDISDLDDTPFDDREIIKQRNPIPSQAQPRPSAAQPSFINPSQIPSGFQAQNVADAAKYKNFQCIYPIYFDSNRSRKDGRMVGAEMAVENPLAREIVAACSMLRLDTLFEPNKIHPKDWANPGRVKVRVKGNKVGIKNSMYPGFWFLGLGFGTWKLI